MASVAYMRDFLAHKYSPKWVEKKNDQEVIRIYHRIIAQAERERSQQKAHDKSC